MDEKQIRIIGALQGGLPIVEEPFSATAAEAGVREEELIEQIRAWKADGTIRRFGAILRHQEAGYRANAMGVWNVPDERTEEFAKVATSSSLVSHCYQRPRFEGFPYNLYTMIHGRSREECQSVADEISRRTGITEYELLYTSVEFKKVSPAYFVNEDPE